MSESRLPRNPPPQPEEGFVVREVATGQSFAIRDLTDEQLAKHAGQANEAHQALTVQAMTLLGQATNAAKASAVLAFEIERRSKTLIRLQ